MTQFSRFRSAVCQFSALLCVATLLAALGVSRANQDNGQPESDGKRGDPRYLFVCAGDQARKNPDFLAVINFDEGSPNYGKVIAQAPLPEPGATGNEFHHIGRRCVRLRPFLGF